MTQLKILKIKEFVLTFSSTILVSFLILLTMQHFTALAILPVQVLVKSCYLFSTLLFLLLLDQNLSSIKGFLNSLGLTNQQIRDYLSFPLLVALETIILYLAVIIPTEYLLTEKYLILKRITGEQKTYLFLAIFLVIFLLNHFWQKLNRLGERGWLIIIMLFIASLVGNKSYTAYYNKLQEQPRIYNISTDWAIQGMPITIEGKNFGGAHQQGQVFVDDFQLIIQKWSEEEIVAVPPVPKEYFTGQLYVKNHYNNKSNKVIFEIRNPGELNN